MASRFKRSPIVDNYEQLKLGLAVKGCEMGSGFGLIIEFIYYNKKGL
jgi:hypothetical protein